MKSFLAQFFGMTRRPALPFKPLATINVQGQTPRALSTSRHGQPAMHARMGRGGLHTNQLSS